MVRIFEKGKYLPLPMCFNVAFISSERLRDSLNRFKDEVKIYGTHIQLDRQGSNQYSLTREQANKLLAENIKKVADSPHSREEFSAWLRCCTILSQENRFIVI